MPFAAERGTTRPGQSPWRHRGKPGGNEASASETGRNVSVPGNVSEQEVALFPPPEEPQGRRERQVQKATVELIADKQPLWRWDRVKVRTVHRAASCRVKAQDTQRTGWHGG